jgi:hypothetical protein
MIVKIFYNRKAGASFFGVSYNTNKVDKNKGELMKVANFGIWQGVANLRPSDYINYLKTLSSLNPNVKKPQFHAVISAKGKLYDKQVLTQIAESWLKEMGYGNQPYLIVFHKDTDHNHVHMVTSRVDRDGKKIDSAFEKVRAIKNLERVLGYEFAMQYQFSTRAQFFMLLESQGYPGIDPNEKRINERIGKYNPDKERAAAIKLILENVKGRENFQEILKQQYHIDLLFHAAEGKKPYGYSIIDHENKRVFKGSEVWPLKELLGVSTVMTVEKSKEQTEAESFSNVHIQSIWIADDVDDQQIHGMRRRRQKKARTNTR